MLNELTIKKAHEGLIKKEFSSVELTAACLARIKKIDPDIQSFITVTEELAIRQAKTVDDKISRGDNIAELAGIPYAAKDIFCVSGTKTTAASRILADFIPPYDSTTTARLTKEDAVLIGKTNLDEFAMGASTENSAFFPTKNPLDYSCVPGGSSGGSAASVAAHEAIYALGTDTGGSIRQPASFCGLVGLKPTYGRTSRFGVMSMASSLDTIGHLSKTVEDSAIVLQAIAGHDQHDATSSPAPLDYYHRDLAQPIKGLKIGIPEGYLDIAGLDPRVKDSVASAIKKISELTATEPEIVKLISPEYALACYYILVPSEVSSNLARYDGVRYGLSVKDAGDLSAVYCQTRASGLGAEAKRRIILGTFALSHGYYDAYYKKAQSVRAIIINDFKKSFEQVDVILMPTTPTVAFKLGEKIDNPLQMYLADLYTISVSLAGLPALSVPCGLIDGLPVGLQIVGPWFGEKRIFQVGHQYEQAVADNGK